MTTGQDLSGMTYTELASLHGELCAAAHHLHVAWDAIRQHGGYAENDISQMLDMVHAQSDKTYKAFRAHPEHPLNTTLDVPLADDTEPTFTERLIKALSEYSAYAADGFAVRKGDQIADFRGDMWTYCHVSRAPQAGKQAKVTVQRDGRSSEFYASVFNLTVS